MGSKKVKATESQNWLKKPRKPQPPYLGPQPKEFLETGRSINVWDGMTLAQLLAEVPEGMDYDNVSFGRLNDYDSDLTLSYTVTEKNPYYEIEMKQYERRKAEYAERMEAYQADKKVYDTWHKMTEEEKKELEAKRQASIKAAKIKKLETELAKLKEG